MEGTFAVRFDMRETVSFVSDYQPIDPKVSNGHEVVRVIEDTGRVIRLQHLLVVSRGTKPMVIKHWRQDWHYEPAQVLTYQGAGRWALDAVPESSRQGRWSQIVWQTDDSPRYGGVGAWRHDGGASRWTSDESRRPLARRDAIRKPPYDHYVGINRHALVPDGWIHEQDNAKIGIKNGQPARVVHEVVLNTYRRNAEFPISAADEYWTKTAAYWAEVRTAWDAEIARRRGITVPEEAQNGSSTGARLMDLASDIATDTATLAGAVADARRIIEAVGKGEPAQAATANAGVVAR